MDDKEAINFHLTNSYTETSFGTFFSGFCGALKDARKMTGRNTETGAKDGTNQFGHLGSWLGAIGYLSLLDQIGGCFRNVKRPLTEKNKSGIIKALKNFSDLDNNQINAIYSLRNSFAHDYSLQNIDKKEREGLTHHFEVNNSPTEPLIILPTEPWKGVLDSKSNINVTKINLQALGDEVEKVVKNLIQLNSNGQIEIILEKGKDELIARYSFVTGRKII